MAIPALTPALVPLLESLPVDEDSVLEDDVGTVKDVVASRPLSRALEDVDADPVAFARVEPREVWTVGFRMAVG